MCILFIAVDNDPPPGGYQLVIANNREEFYARPTKPAARWDDCTHCVSGLDQEPGREGGTWLGLSEAGGGRFSSLLNILARHPDRKMKGRGFLVSDYLRDPKVSASEYTAPLERDRASYNPFNLVILEKRSQKWNLHYFSSDDESSPCDLDLTTDSVFAFGNSSRACPWRKVTEGRNTFSQIVADHRSVTDRERLTQRLISLLNDAEPHLPDPQLQSQATVAHLDDEATVQRSGFCVRSPQIQYGTRTNTVILIDASGHGEYTERTMREPIDPYNPVWDTQTIAFKLGETV